MRIHVAAVWILTFLKAPFTLGQLSFYDTQRCVESCMDSVSALPTVIPNMVKEKVFTGSNCPIYPKDYVRNCTLHGAARDVVIIDGGHYFLSDLELSWFGAQKFCHSGGWLLGAMTSPMLEREILRAWQSRLEGSDLWSGVTSSGTKAATFAGAESGRTLTELKFDKGTTEKACIIYPSIKSGRALGVPGDCKKKARFFCQLPPNCPMSIETCNAVNYESSLIDSCVSIVPEKKIKSIMSTSCDGPTCALSPSCTDRVKAGMKIFDPEVPLPFGQLVSSCGKKYYFARDFYPLKMSVDFCCSIGMRLIGVETQAKLKCAAAAIAKAAKDAGARWWTSGTDAGCPGKLAWCGSGEMYSEAELGRLEGYSDGLERCAVLKSASASSAVLNVASCEEFNRPLCEGSFEPRRIYYHPKCPTVLCNLNLESLKYTADHYNVPIDPQRTLGFFHFLDRHFFVSRATANWSEAQNKCCSLGMKLITLYTDEVFEKLKKLLDAKSKEDSAYAGVKISTEKLTFWTSGYEWQKSMFVWCHSGDAMPNFNSWSKVNVQLQNGDAGNCVMAEVGSIVNRLNSVNCAQKHNFVCEQFIDDTGLKKCSSGKCFYSGSSDEFPQATRSQVRSLEPSKGKIVLDTCRRHLFVTKDATYYFRQQASVCQSLGMRPLFLQTKEDWTCVLNALGNLFDLGDSAVNFHFPLSDFDCPGKYAWCGTGKRFDATFLDSYSKVFNLDQKSRLCFGAQYRKNNTVPKFELSKEECDKADSQRRVICEAAS